MIDNNDKGQYRGLAVRFGHELESGVIFTDTALRRVHTHSDRTGEHLLDLQFSFATKD